jgi:hypothetical protein
LKKLLEDLMLTSFSAIQWCELVKSWTLAICWNIAKCSDHSYVYLVNTHLKRCLTQSPGWQWLWLYLSCLCTECSMAWRSPFFILSNFNPCPFVLALPCVLHLLQFLSNPLRK